MLGLGGSELQVGLDGSDASFVDTRCKGEFNSRIGEGGGGRGRGTGVTPLLIKKRALYVPPRRPLSRPILTLYMCILA